jgi:WD40 repeat protein
MAAYFLVKNVLFGPGQIAESAWQEFSPPGARCKLLLPGTPQTQTQVIPGTAIQSRHHQVVLKNPNCVFGVAHFRMPPQEMGRLTLEERFEGARQGMLANTPGATFVSQREIKLDGHPGREIVMQMERRGKMTARLYVVGPDFYILLAGGDGFEPTTPDVVKFFDSFQLVGQPAIPDPLPNKDRPPDRDRPQDKDRLPDRDRPRENDPPPKKYPLPLQHTLGQAGNRSIISVAFLADGQRLAASSARKIRDEKIELWKLRLGRPEEEIVNPPRGAATVVAAPSGGKAAALATAHGLYLCDPRSLQVQKTLLDPGETRQGQPAAAAFSPDGKTLASLDNTDLILWDVETGQNRKKHPVQRELRSAGKPRVLFAPNGSSLLVSNYSPTISLRDPLTGEDEKNIVCVDGLKVMAMAVSRDGKYLAVGGTGPSVQLWDFDRRTLLARLDGAAGWVHDLAFTPDGARLIAVGADGIVIWTVQDRQVALKWNPDQGVVHSLSLSPGVQMATGGADGTVKVWDASSIMNGNRIPQAPGNPKLRFAFAPQAHPVQFTFTPDGQKLTTWEGADQVQFRDISEQAVRTPRAMQSGQLAYTTDGKFLLRGSQKETQVRDMTGPAAPERRLPGEHVAVSPDGTLIACSGEQGVKLFRYPNFMAEPGLPDAFTGVGPVVFSPDSKLLVCAARGDTIHAWDIATKKTKWIGEGHVPPRDGDRPGIVGLGFSKDGKRVMSAGTDRTLRFWDAGAGEEQLKVSLAFAPVALTLAPSEPLLVLRGSNGDLWLYDSETGAAQGKTFPDIASLVNAGAQPSTLAISPDGRLLVSWSGGSILGWRLPHLKEPPGPAPTRETPPVQDLKVAELLAEKGAALIPLANVSSSQIALVFSPDGATVALKTASRALRLVDVATGKTRLVRVGDVGFCSMAWSPDGLLAEAATGDLVRIRDGRTGRIVRSVDLLVPPFELTNRIGWGPEGKTLIVRTERETRLLDVSENDIRTRETLGSVRGFLVFSKDGKKHTTCTIGVDGRLTGDRSILDDPGVFVNLSGTVAAISEKAGLMAMKELQHIRISEIRTGKSLGVIKAESPLSQGMALSSDGKRLATTGIVGEVKLWDPRTLGQTGVIRMGQRQNAGNLAFSPDGKLLAGVSNEGIHLWRLDEKSPAVELLKPPPPPRAEIRDVNGSMKRLTFAAGDKKLFGLVVNVGGPPPARTHVKLWDVASGRAEAISKGPGPLFADLFAVSADGKRLAVSVKGQVTCLEVGSDTPPLRLRDVPLRFSATGMAFAPDGKTLLVGFDDRIVFWDVEANEVKRKLTVNEQPVILRLSEDGKTLTTVLQTLERMKQAMSETITPHLRLQSWELPSEKVTSGTRLNEGIRNETVLAPDGKHLVSSGSGGISLRNLETDKFQLMRTQKPQKSMASLAFTSDGKYLYAGVFGGALLAWDMTERAELFAIPRAHRETIRGVAVSLDGKTLATAGDDGIIKLWDLAVLKQSAGK